MFTSHPMSCMTCHVSCVTCHMSHVTYQYIYIFMFFLYFFPGQYVEPSQWRVCYQRGLHCQFHKGWLTDWMNKWMKKGFLYNTSGYTGSVKDIYNFMKPFHNEIYLCSFFLLFLTQLKYLTTARGVIALVQSTAHIHCSQHRLLNDTGSLQPSG